ncbi:uncharacterized protein LOC112203220 [Rosa chinensis]|uniref:uncharacterized protein LOC112203220 n=1 Tax=Rosa chinensis TaxID=74649 RepID=UPI000D091369|nr:uncharacterized protein LOC112203220 [Rosa chinensis]
MKEKEDAIRLYLTPRNGLPEDITKQIMANIKHDILKKKLDTVVDMDLLLSLVPWNIEISIKQHVGMNAVKNVRVLQGMDVRVLEKICEYLKPVTYPDGHKFQTKDAIDSMLFITEGEIISTILPCQEKLDCFGEQLLWWVSPSISCTNLDHPKPTQNVQCHGKVEAFALLAKDLKSVVTEFRRQWNWGLYRCDTGSPDLPRPRDMTNETYIRLWQQKLIEARKNKISEEILKWLESTCLGDEVVNRKVRKHIRETNVEKKEMDAVVDLRFIFSILPQDIKSTIGMKALRNVDLFKKMPDSMLENVSMYLHPVIYDENSYVVKAGTKLDLMLFVIKGLIICTNTSTDVATTGSYMIPKLFLEKVQVSKRVEAFSLKASQLQDVVSRFGNKWSEYFTAPNHENKTYLQKLKEVHKQLATTTWAEIDDEEFKQQMKIMTREKDILDWLLRIDFPEDVTTKVMENIKEKKVVEKDVDRPADCPVDVEYLLSVDLPWTIEKRLRDHLCMHTLEKVPLLQDMPKAILESICSNLKPVVYRNNNHYVVKKGEELDLMLIIVEGEIILTDNDPVSSEAETTNSSIIPQSLGKGHFFGDELLNWFSPANKFAGSAPISPHNVLCQTKVEAFTLTRSMLRSVVSDHNSDWMSKFKNVDDAQQLKDLKILDERIDEQLGKTNLDEIVDEESEQQVKIKNKEKEIDNWVSRNGFDEELKTKIRFHMKINNAVEENIDAEVDVEYLFSLKFPWIDIAKPVTEHLCMGTLKKVPMLQKMPEDVWKKMCFHLEAVVYNEKEFVVREGQSFDFVLIIVEGEIEWTIATSDGGPADSTLITKGRGDFFGERLLNWASPKIMFFGSAPISKSDVKCKTKVEAFRLTTKHLRSVVSEYDLEWNSKFIDCNDPQQMYMQWQKGTIKLNEIEDEELRKAVKIKIKENDIFEWMSSNGLSEELKEKIKLEIQKRNAVERNINTDLYLKFILSLGGIWDDITKGITEHFCIDTLKRVPMLQLLHEDVFKKMSFHVEAVFFNENDFIVQKGQSLDFVLIIVEGLIEWTNMTSDVETTDPTIITKEKGDIFGEKLLNWASPSIMFSGSAPTSTEDVLCRKKIQAFSLTAENLRSVVYDYKREWNLNFKNCNGQQQSEVATIVNNKIDETYKQLQLGTIILNDIEDEELRKAMKIKIKENDIFEWMSSNGLSEELTEKIKLEIQKRNAIERNIDTDLYLKFILSLGGIWDDITKGITEHFCISTLKRVPMLQLLHEDVFKKMSFHVEAVVFNENDFIVQKGQSLNFVLIIVEGVIEWTDMTSDVETADPTIITKKKGDIFGEKLLNWASPEIMFLGSAPTSMRDVKCRKKVQAFSLTAKNLRSVVYEYKHEWNSNFKSCNDQQQLEGVIVLRNNIDKTYKQLQLGTIRLNEIEDEELRKAMKIKNKENDIFEWMSSNCLSEPLKEKIKLEIQKTNAIEMNMDTDLYLKFILSLGGIWDQITRGITEHFCIGTLKRVPVLQLLHEDVFKKMSFHVEAVFFNENDFIVQKGQSLDFVLIIVEGVIEWTDMTSDVKTTDPTIITKKKGDIFGEKLLNWASPNIMFSGSAPTSTEDVLCRKKIQAFSLTAENLRSVVYNYKLEWDSNFNNC